ncbi:MAG: hypothetical protein JKY66_09190 [Spongiibacteraceae bacterium]|nr:hypothetical protein [Spongiibacteraceae bacterium]
MMSARNIFEETLLDLEKKIESEMSQSIHDINAINSRSRVLGVVLLSVLAVVVIAISFITSRSISSALENITNITREIASGNWGEAIKGKANDETDLVLESVDAMRKTLSVQHHRLEYEANLSAMLNVVDPIEALNNAMNLIQELLGLPAIAVFVESNNILDLVALVSVDDGQVNKGNLQGLGLAENIWKINKRVSTKCPEDVFIGINPSINIIRYFEGFPIAINNQCKAVICLFLSESITDEELWYMESSLVQIEFKIAQYIGELERKILMDEISEKAQSMIVAKTEPKKPIRQKVILLQTCHMS